MAQVDVAGYLRSLAEVLPDAQTILDAATTVASAAPRVLASAGQLASAATATGGPVHEDGEDPALQRDALISAYFLPPGPMGKLGTFDTDGRPLKSQDVESSAGLLCAASAAGAVQVWQVLRKPGATSALRDLELAKIASVRTGSQIRAAVLLPQPEEFWENPGHRSESEREGNRPGARLQASAPLVALLPLNPSSSTAAAQSSGTQETEPPSLPQLEHFAPHLVRLFSLRSGSNVGDLKFKNAVRGVYATPRVVVVASGSQLLIFHAFRLQHLFSIDAYEGVGSFSTLGTANASPAVRVPHVSPTVAVSTRWIAFEGCEELPPLDEAPWSAEKIAETAKDTVTSVASSLFESGSKAWSNYWTGPSHDNSRQAPPPPERSPTDPGGTVVVYDVVSRRRVAHFRAHSHPLAAMAWDPSGTVLVTADIQGRQMQVFQIGTEPTHRVSNVPVAPSTSTGRPAKPFGMVRHMYSLQRGMTDAEILNLSVSADSRWVAASSSHGTTHVFPIVGTGGAVSCRTHVPSQITSTLPQSHVQPFVQIAGEPFAITAAQRVQQPAMARLLALLGRSETAGLQLSSATEFVGTLGKQSLLLVSQLGYLTKYGLAPQVAVESTGGETQAAVLALQMKAQLEWDVCRRVGWEDEALDLVDIETTPTDSSRWKSQAEIASARARGQLSIEAVDLPPDELSEADSRRNFHFEELPVKDLRGAPTAGTDAGKGGKEEAPVFSRGEASLQRDSLVNSDPPLHFLSVLDEGDGVVADGVIEDPISVEDEDSHSTSTSGPPTSMFSTRLGGEEESGSEEEGGGRAVLTTSDPPMSMFG